MKNKVRMKNNKEKDFPSGNAKCRCEESERSELSSLPSTTCSPRDDIIRVYGFPDLFVEGAVPLPEHLKNNMTEVTPDDPDYFYTPPSECLTGKGCVKDECSCGLNFQKDSEVSLRSFLPSNNSPHE